MGERILRWFIPRPYDDKADKKEIKDILGPNIQPHDAENLGFNGEDFVCLAHDDPVVMEQSTKPTKDGRFVYKCPRDHGPFGHANFVVYGTGPHPQAKQT